MNWWLLLAYKKGVNPAVVEDEVLEFTAECCNDVIGNISDGVGEDPAIVAGGERYVPLLLLRLPGNKPFRVLINKRKNKT